MRWTSEFSPKLHIGSCQGSGDSDLRQHDGLIARDVVCESAAVTCWAAGGDGVEQLEVELESGAHRHTDSGEVSLVVRTDKPL